MLQKMNFEGIASGSERDYRVHLLAVVVMRSVAADVKKPPLAVIVNDGLNVDRFGRFVDPFGLPPLMRPRTAPISGSQHRLASDLGDRAMQPTRRICEAQRHDPTFDHLCPGCSRLSMA
jgi:hypothetical protein